MNKFLKTKLKKLFFSGTIILPLLMGACSNINNESNKENNSKIENKQELKINSKNGINFNHNDKNENIIKISFQNSIQDYKNLNLEVKISKKNDSNVSLKEKQLYDNNQFEYNFNFGSLLNSGIYQISEITINEKSINYTPFEFEVKSFLPTERLSANSISIEKLTSNSVDLKITFNQKIDSNSLSLINLEINEESNLDNYIIFNNGIAENDFSVKFALNDLKSDLGYVIKKLKFQNENIIFPKFSFKTNKDNQLPQIQNISLNEASISPDSTTLNISFNQINLNFNNQKVKFILQEDNDENLTKESDLILKTNKSQYEITFNNLESLTKYHVQKIILNDQNLVYLPIFNFTTKEKIYKNEINSISVDQASLTTYSAKLNVVFNSINLNDVNHKVHFFVEEKNALKPFIAEANITLEKDKLSYIVDFSSLQGPTDYRLQKIILKNKILEYNTVVEFSTPYQGLDEDIFEFQNYHYDSNNSSIESLKLDFDLYFNKKSENGLDLTGKNLKLVVEDSKSSKLIESNPFTIENIVNEAQKLNATFTNLEPKATYQIKKLVISDLSDENFIFVSPYFIFQAPYSESSNSSNSQITKLQNEINPVIAVKYSNSVEKNNLINEINDLFVDFKNASISNVELQNEDNQKLLAKKLQNATLNFNLNLNDSSNFLDLTNFNFDDNKSLAFDFTEKNTKKNLIDNVYNLHQPVFANQIKYAIVGGDQNIQYGRNVYDDNRVYGTTMAYDVMFKLNGFNVPDRHFKLKFVIAQGFYGDVVLQRYRLMFVTNQIWLSIYKNYFNYLNNASENIRLESLKNMKVLLEAIYYGKNAKKIFQQFLKGNSHYQIDQFINQIQQPFSPQTIDSTKSLEPNYLQSLVQNFSEDEAYENILVYLNYLNMNLNKSRAKDDYYYHNDDSTKDVYISHLGGNSHHTLEQKNRYNNESELLTIKTNDQNQIVKIDFNKMLY